MDNKYRILDDILYNHSSRFDEDVIRYLLDKTPKEELFEEKLIERRNSGRENFSVKTNFFGKVLAFEAKLQDNDETLNKWKKLLLEVNPDLDKTRFLLTPTTSPTGKDKIIEVNLDTIRTISKLNDYLKRPDDFSNIDKTVVALEILSTTQESYCNILGLASKSIEHTIELVFNERENLEKDFLTEANTFVSRLMNSEITKKAIFSNPNKEVALKFNKEDFEVIMRECFGQTSKHDSNKSFLFANIMNTQDPEIWINAYQNHHKKTKSTKSDSFPILTLLKGMFFNVYGINLTETKNEEAGKRLNEPAQHIMPIRKSELFHEILDYLLPVLKDKINSKQIAEIYNSSFRLNDNKLVDILNKHIPFESFFENLEDSPIKKAITEKLSEDKYRVYVVKKDTDENGNNLRPFSSWKEWRIDTNRKELEATLGTNTPKPKKMKV